MKSKYGMINSSIAAVAKTVEPRLPADASRPESSTSVTRATHRHGPRRGRHPGRPAGDGRIPRQIEPGLIRAMGMGKQRDVGNAVSIAAESWVPEQMPLHHGQRLLATRHAAAAAAAPLPVHALPAENAGCNGPRPHEAHGGIARRTSSARSAGRACLRPARTGLPRIRTVPARLHAPAGAPCRQGSGTGIPACGFCLASCPSRSRHKTGRVDSTAGAPCGSCPTRTYRAPSASLQSHRRLIEAGHDGRFPPKRTGAGMLPTPEFQPGSISCRFQRTAAVPPTDAVWVTNCPSSTGRRSPSG